MPAFESLRPGAPLAVALVVGDFDMSGIGTVTHVEGSRVWGWGHPFLGLGACALPMYSAHIHAVYPRQTVSFKMGSPMHLVGTLDCDVSTGVSGVLGPGPNMIPVEASMQRDTSGPVRRYACQVAPHRSLFPHLVFGILTNCVDVEGELPEELTAELNLRIELEDQPPLVLHDVISGPALAGTRAPATLYTPITTMLQTLLSAPYEGIAITRITCATRFHSRRSTAEIESARLASDWYAPGDSVHASVILKPYRGSKQRVDVQLALPVELPDGEYTLQISDDATHVRLLLRDHPLLGLPQSRERLLEQQRLLCGVKRSHLVARLAIPGGGLAVEGQELSHLPASVAEQLSEVRRGSGTSQPLTTLVMAREETPYVLQGLHRLKFRVSRQKPRLP
jgi:hypothetical protein